MAKRHLRELTMWGGLLVGLAGVVMLLVPTRSESVTVLGASLLALGWAALAAVTFKRKRSVSNLNQLRTELRHHDERELQRTRRLEAAIEAERAKESRHEYISEKALARIETRLRDVMHRPVALHDPFTSFESTDILFVTSNGAGLGHLARLLAVADQLHVGTDAAFLTLSKAYKQVAHRGYPIHYFPSAEAAGVTSERWNFRFQLYLQSLIARVRPKIVVFDGTVVYSGLTEVCRGHGIPLIWMQRGCWKPEAVNRYPARHNASAVADHVIVPGDYACPEIVNVGDGVEVAHVGPIVLLSREDLLDPEQARTELGLSAGRRHILINLGGGSASDHETHRNLLKQVIQNTAPEWQVTVVRSPLARNSELPPGVNTVRRFPVARYVRAFDFVVSAAGYNSVQEAAALQIPALLVPNPATQTDDQVRRARYAAEQGWALAACDATEVGQAVRELTGDPERLASLRGRLSALSEPTGAVEAAGILQKLAQQATWYMEDDFIPTSSAGRHAGGNPEPKAGDQQ